MPRRKQYKISARQTAIYDVIVAELQQNPELADYDMGTIEISIKKKITLNKKSERYLNQLENLKSMLFLTWKILNE